jgi:hypothetical protein
VVFAVAIVAGIPSYRKPEEKGFNKEVSMKPNIECPLALGATMNFLFGF